MTNEEIKELAREYIDNCTERADGRKVKIDFSIL